MKEAFKIYKKREEVIENEVKRKRDQEYKKERLEEKERLRILEIRDKRNEKTNELLEKYPKYLSLERYGNFLEKEVKNMGGRLKGLKIINENGEFDNGHLAEEDFLNSSYISRSQRILTLQDRGNDSKEAVFNDLVNYYSDAGFQKTEQCKLGRASSKYLDGVLRKMDSEIEISRIRFYTAVGTPLDFSFGVDAWVEIEEENGHKEKIFFDMKTGGFENKKSFYADLILSVMEKDGRVDMTTKANQQLVISFLNEVAEIYFEKKKGKGSS